jgi:hypothetical protein
MKANPQPALRERHATGVRIVPVVMMPQPAPEAVPIFRRFRLRRRPAFEYRRGAVCRAVCMGVLEPLPLDLRKPVWGGFQRIYELVEASSLSAGFDPAAAAGTGSARRRSGGPAGGAVGRGGVEKY